MDRSAARSLTAGLVGGAALVAIGVGAYIVTDFASTTALIPAIFGVMIGLLAAVGRRSARPDRSILGIGLLALLVAVGSSRGLLDLVDLATGGEVAAPVAAVAQGLAVLVAAAIVVVTVDHARA